jgi:hypothetical protein
MKKNVRTFIMLVLFSATSVIAVAQENQTAVKAVPKWVSDKGYWVIVSNIKSPKTSVVHFYNNENTRVYSEKVEGVRLNIKRKQTCMRLKRALDKSLIAWEKRQPGNEQLVKAIFNQK